MLRNRAAAADLPEVNRTLEALEKQLKEKQDDQKRLALVAPKSGIVLPPPEVPAPPGMENELPKWTGSPLDKKNLGAFLGGETRLFCQIGDPRYWEAHLAIDQEDVDFIHRDQAVAIKLDEMPYRTFHSKISEIGPEMKYSSKQISSKGGGELMSKTEEGGIDRPINITYQALAELDDPDGRLVQGLRGTAKVHADWQPLGSACGAYLVRTFNFKL